MLLASASRTFSAAPGVGRRAASAIASKYSKALFGAASKNTQNLTKVSNELTALQNVLKSDPKVGQFLSNPTLSSQEREAGLSLIYNKLESSGGKKETVSEITKNLFKVLTDNGRLNETEAVIVGFKELLAEYKGELTVTVTSATPLNKDVLSRLETSLKQSQTAQAAKMLKIENKVNPTILGGLIIDFGAKSIDLSVQARVTKLNNVLQQSV